MAEGNKKRDREPEKNLKTLIQIYSSVAARGAGVYFMIFVAHRDIMAPLLVQHGYFPLFLRQARFVGCSDLFSFARYREAV